MLCYAIGFTEMEKICFIPNNLLMKCSKSFLGSQFTAVTLCSRQCGILQQSVFLVYVYVSRQRYKTRSSFFKESYTASRRDFTMILEEVVLSQKQYHLKVSQTMNNVDIYLLTWSVTKVFAFLLTPLYTMTHSDTEIVFLRTQ